MKIFKIKKIESLNQKLNTKNIFLSKTQLKEIKGGSIVEEDAEGI